MSNNFTLSQNLVTHIPHPRAGTGRDANGFLRIGATASFPIANSPSPITMTV